MTLEEIKKYDDEVVDQETFDLLMEDENVLDCENNGSSGRSDKQQYTWFTLSLSNGEEIQIYG